ncbi:MAG: hypothetical protein GEU80_08230 [Dehalococcoidia bacterium]|nr:hypothetical protein [Dehalococcoidia bacterium]
MRVAVLGRLRLAPVALVAPPAWGEAPDDVASGDSLRANGADIETGAFLLRAVPARDAGEAPSDVDGEPAPVGPTPQTPVADAVADARDSTLCVATRADGEPCRARAVPGRGVCIGHGEWRRASGGARRRGSRGDRALAPVLDQLERALAGLVEGRLDARQAAVAASIGRLLLAAHGSEPLQQRLQALEHALPGVDNLPAD